MKGPTRHPAIRRAIARAVELGYRVEFRPLAVDALAPALIPPAGFCDRERRLIVVGLRMCSSRAMIAAVIEHEVEHAEGADVATDRPEFGLRCGNRTG
jgi:hypothetical protein